MKLNRALAIVGIFVLFSHNAHAMKSRTIAGLLALGALSGDQVSADHRGVAAHVLQFIVLDVDVDGYDATANSSIHVFDASRDVVASCHNIIMPDYVELSPLLHAIAASDNVDEKDRDGKTGLGILGDYLSVDSSRKCTREFGIAFSYLLHAGANAPVLRYDWLNDNIPLNNSLLHRAVQYGHSDLIAFLVNDGMWGNRIDIDDTNALGETPLHLVDYFNACCLAENACNLFTVMWTLFSHQPNPNSQNAYYRYTSLFSAPTRDIARYLIRKGADIEIVGRAGYRPLTVAAEASDDILVEVLLAHGANRDARTDDGETALDIAERRYAECPYIERALPVLQLLNGSITESPFSDFCPRNGTEGLMAERYLNLMSELNLN